MCLVLPTFCVCFEAVAGAGKLLESTPAHKGAATMGVVIPPVLIRHTSEMDWERSPARGVWRKRLLLEGPAESGRVTSVVQYEPGSRFPEHAHPAGEEILVLEGQFCDEGRHPAGTYLLNPDGFRHAPFTEEGCILFVKLKQYPGAERKQVRVDTFARPWVAVAEGLREISLYSEDAYPEKIKLVKIAAGTNVGDVDHPLGEEIFVLDGDLEDEHGSYKPGSWVRFAPGTTHSPRTDRGCTLYVKKGHL